MDKYSRDSNTIDKKSNYILNKNIVQIQELQAKCEAWHAIYK